MRRGRLLTAALLSLAPPAAAQQLSDPRHYELVWIIGAHEIPAGDFWVREQGQVVDTRLLPPELYVAEGPVMASDRRTVMAAGQQVVRLRARQFIACNIRRGASGTRAAGKRVCLVDTDGDDRFDSYFERGLGGGYWFELTGEVPDQLDRIEAPSFRRLPPEQMIGAPMMALHYQRILDGGIRIPVTEMAEGSNLVRFHFKVGDDSARRQWMVRPCQSQSLPSFCTSAAFPSQFRFAGLVVDLLERRREDIRMRIAAPFSPVAVRFADLHQAYAAGDVILVDQAGGQ